MRQMIYQDIREKILNWQKYPGCRPVLRAPLLTPGFPGTFNMSYTEHHWLKEFGSYVNWDHDCIISTVQSCIRLNDLRHLLGDDGYRYLGVFEMADLNGEIALQKTPDYAEMMAWQMSELVTFLGELDIPRERIHASYCAGGEIKYLTRGAYEFPFQVPADVATKNALLQAGVPEGNIIPDRSRDTLLALHIHRPTPWGYRTEIYINIGTLGSPSLLDAATSEYLLFNPVFDDGIAREHICGLEKSSHGYFGISFGLERLCMAVNGLSNIHEVDYLKEFYDVFRSIVGRPELGKQDYFIGESLRALHRVLTDRDFHPEAAVTNGRCGKKSMSVRRRKKVASLKKNIPQELHSEGLLSLLKTHSAAQPWHNHLEEMAEVTVREIEEYRKN